MEFRIWVEIRLTGRLLERQLVAQVERAGGGPEEIGLILEEGKSVLQQVQACMIQRQVESCRPLTGDASTAGVSSASRIKEPAV